MLSQTVVEQIKSILESGQVLCDEPMKNHTTFRVGGNADIYVSISSEEELVNLISYLKDNNISYFIIGNGSNLLVSDEGFRGVIIEIGDNYNDITISNGIINAKAGALMSKVAHFALENSMTGFEFAAGIPGTIGGGVIMNAGAYGGELCQVIKDVKVILPDGSIDIIANQDMEFGYRYSKAKKEGYIILEANIELALGDKPMIEEKMKDLGAQRREKQPLEYPSAGSTFKRPEGYFAGKLISDANLKGYSVGDAQVSEKHAGFVINRGNASAKDIFSLICDVQRKVKEEFKVELSPEVIILGNFE